MVRSVFSVPLFLFPYLSMFVFSHFLLFFVLSPCLCLIFVCLFFSFISVLCMLPVSPLNMPSIARRLEVFDEHVAG